MAGLSSRGFSLLLALVVTLSGGGDGARTTTPPLLRECYVCGPQDDHCGDAAMELAKMEVCEGRMCFKSKELNKEGGESVVRGCWQVEAEDTCTLQILAGAEYYTCHCIGDRCNPAAAPAIALPLLLLALMSANYFAY